MKTKGFTLIEIMAVLAIISLITSVVLGTINEGRTKAGAARFKQEVNEFIKATELYYDENGLRYPGEENGAFMLMHYQDGSISTEEPSNLIERIEPYTTKIPKPSINGSYPYFLYRNAYNYQGPITDTAYRCEGHPNSLPPARYLILVSAEEPEFETWPYYQYCSSYNRNTKTWSSCTTFQGLRCHER